MLLMRTAFLKLEAEAERLRTQALQCDDPNEVLAILDRERQVWEAARAAAYECRQLAAATAQWN